MDDNIPVIQRGDSPLLQPVQTDLMEKFNVNPELFKPIYQQQILQGIQEAKRMYDNIPKTNPVVEELKAVKSELQTQTAKVDEVLEENAELQTKLDKSNEINQRQSDEITVLRKQLQESTASKVSKRVGDFIWGLFGGVVLALILYGIGKWLGISL